MGKNLGVRSNRIASHWMPQWRKKPLTNTTSSCRGSPVKLPPRAANSTRKADKTEDSSPAMVSTHGGREELRANKPGRFPSQGHTCMRTCAPGRCMNLFLQHDIASNWEKDHRGSSIGAHRRGGLESSCAVPSSATAELACLPMRG